MKLDRLLAITMLLLNRRRVGAKELSDRFEVSLRTIYRDMETLGQSGIPIISYAGAEGGYEIMEQYRLERQFLSLEELHALVIALRGVQNVALDREIGGLLDKVGSLLAGSERDQMEQASDRMVIDINPWNGQGPNDDSLKTLKEAISDSRIIRFAYTANDGGQSLRECEPMKLVLKGFVWYVYGYCLMRQDFRIFRLSRVRELTMTGALFVRREQPSQERVLEWGTSFHSGDRVMTEITLKFAPGARARAEDYFNGWREGKSKQETGDGGLLVQSIQPDEPWLLNWLLGFGEDVHVLSPPDLAARLREKALAVAQLYSNC